MHLLLLEHALHIGDACRVQGHAGHAEHAIGRVEHVLHVVDESTLSTANASAVVDRLLRAVRRQVGAIGRHRR